MRFVILTLITFSMTICFSQSTKITLGQVQKTINNSYQNLIRKERRIISIPWATCNDDSVFFKVDTIRLYKNTSNYFSTVGCCNYLYWAFSSKKDMTQETTYSMIADSSPCKDTSLLKGEEIQTSKDLTYQLEADNGKILITTFDNGKAINVFQVLSIDKVIAGERNELTERITLKRLR